MNLNELQGFLRFPFEGRRELWVFVWFFQSGKEGSKEVEELKKETRFRNVLGRLDPHCDLAVSAYGSELGCLGPSSEMCH